MNDGSIKAAKTPSKEVGQCNRILLKEFYGRLTFESLLHKWPMSRPHCSDSKANEQAGSLVRDTELSSLTVL